MSRLLEILGRGMEIDTPMLIWHWLGVARHISNDADSEQLKRLDKVAELIWNNKEQAGKEQLRIYLFDNPSCVLGRMAAAAIWLSNNKLDRAIEELNSVYMRQPNNTMALYALGHCYERLGKEAEAVEFYQDCLKFKNYLQLPRQRLAAVYFKRRQIEKTILEHQLLRNEYPDDIATLVTLGYLYITGGDFDEAVEAFNKAILIHPDNFHYDNNQIDQLIHEGQIQEALEKVEDLIAVEGEKPDLLFKRADMLTMLGVTSDALSLFEQVVQMNPDFLEATIKLGTQYLQMSRFEQAAIQFNRAVEINDRIVDAYIGLTIAQKAGGDKKQALKTLSLAAAIQPNSSLLFAEVAKWQFMVDAEQGAGEQLDKDEGRLLEKVIEAHRQQTEAQCCNPDLYYRFGMLMMSVGRMNDAVEVFQTALEINPTYHRAKSKLAVCLYETERHEVALEQLNRPESMDRKTIELHYKVALLYCDRIKFASSLINLEQHMQNIFAETDATVNISIVLQNLGLLDRAVAMWDNLSTTASQALNPKDSFLPPDQF